MFMRTFSFALFRRLHLFLQSYVHRMDFLSLLHLKNFLSAFVCYINVKSDISLLPLFVLQSWLFSESNKSFLSRHPSKPLYICLFVLLTPLYFKRLRKDCRRLEFRGMIGPLFYLQSGKYAAGVELLHIWKLIQAANMIPHLSEEKTQRFST